ncbi:MAG TPA: hypothetical protein VIQ77_07195 [Mucilaginibacter sp.]|jgi:hypothetical protein
MTDLYKNKYRIPSARLQTWDYRDNGLYFVTICTANHECLFGNILERERAPETRSIASLLTGLTDPIMQLNDLGKFVEKEWLKTPALRPDMNLELQEYVIMPNHFHGIIYIGENSYNDGDRRDAKHRVFGNHNRIDIMHRVFNPKNKFGTQSKNLASIIRDFKSAVTMYARINDIPFKWQPRFHDHIITSNDEYQKIADYIMENPLKWQADKFYNQDSNLYKA